MVLMGLGGLLKMARDDVALAVAQSLDGQIDLFLGVLDPVLQRGGAAGEEKERGYGEDLFHFYAFLFGLL